MKIIKLTFVMIIMGGSSPLLANTLVDKVPPDIRKACEKDVRRFCVRKNSTESQVIACVKRNFDLLNSQCKVKLAKAGF